MKDLKTDLDVSRRRYFDLRPDLDVHLPRKRLFLLPFFVQERGNGNLDVKLQAVRLWDEMVDHGLRCWLLDRFGFAKTII